MPPAIAELTGAPPPVNNNDQNQIAKPVIGIIYPPPEVRNIVDKTANFVARNGPEFESRIRQNELNNPKFNFLNGGDPYHAYYQHKVNDFREGKAELPPSLADAGLAPSLAGAKPASQSAPAGTRDSQDMFRSTTDRPVVVTDPPPHYEFIVDPPSISALDIDVVRLTAQFVARNGRQFLTNLMNREQRNYLFDFLRPQHSLFQYFTRLLEQYTKVLIPPKQLLSQLQQELDTPEHVLDAVRYRVAWQRAQEARVRSEEEALERERVSYAQIDWHDFVVVETVDYQPGEPGQFPPPTTPQLVGQRVLMQDRLEDGEEMQMSDDEDELEERDGGDTAAGREDSQVQDMEQDSASDDDDDEDDQVAGGSSASAAAAGGAGSESDDRQRAPKLTSATTSQQPPLPPLPPKPDQVVVKKYDPKAAARPSRAAAVDEYLISPITGEKIPAARAAEHMRIGLLDPRWLEQRGRQQDERHGSQSETVLAAGGAITAHLHNLAERRTDIFGAGDAETSIGRKIGEEDEQQQQQQQVSKTGASRAAGDKAIWDGHSSSVSATTRAARANITLDDQISHIHRTEGLLPDPNLEKIGPKPGSGSSSSSSAARSAIDAPPLLGSAPPLPPQPPPPGSAAPRPPPPPLAEPRPPLVATTPSRLPAPPEPMRHVPTQPLLARPLSQPLLPGGPGGGMAARPQVLLPNPPMLAMHQAMSGGYMQQVNPRMGASLMGPAPGVVAGAGAGASAAAAGAVYGGDDDGAGPMAKKPRTDDHLVPEQMWLARCGGAGAHVTFTVHVPLQADKSEWQLRGQSVTLTLPLTDTVSVLKARLHEETALPPGKQKLSLEGVFFKDTNSLAFYNVANGNTVQLQLKERGGRKK